MIKSVTDRSTLERLLGARRDIYAEKIRSFADGYGFIYNFCHFAAQDDTVVICDYYGDATAAVIKEPSDDQAAELSEFLAFGRCRKILMTYELCEQLGLSESAEKLYLMKRGYDVKSTVDCNKETFGTDAPLGQIYEIVSSGFDIDRDTWYTDTSHMIRHGIARAYTSNGAAAIRMFASGGISYISYVCTRPEMRGRGLAKALLKYICAEEASNGNEVYVFCEERLRGFYKSAGFEPAGKACQIGADIL